jgi:hypothetical protein
MRTTTALTALFSRRSRSSLHSLMLSIIGRFCSWPFELPATSSWIPSQCTQRLALCIQLYLTAVDAALREHTNEDEALRMQDCNLRRSLV